MRFKTLLTADETGGNGPEKQNNPAAAAVLKDPPAPAPAPEPKNEPKPAPAAPAKSPAVDPQAKRIRDLETKIAELEDENARLRKCQPVNRPAIPKPTHQPAFKKSFLDGLTVLDT